MLVLSVNTPLLSIHCVPGSGNLVTAITDVNDRSSQRVSRNQRLQGGREQKMYPEEVVLDLRTER